jgi:1-acyl-sn-glycerol-3-phosphate acyltransferase
MFLLFIIYNYYLLTREFIMSFGNLSYKSQTNWGNSIYKFNKWLYKWKQNVISSVVQSNRVLMIVNHENLVDFINIQIFLSRYYPHHRHIFVTNKITQYIPIFSNFINKNHMVLYNPDDSQLRVNEHKYVIVLFIEGAIYNPTNLNKSNHWCNATKISHFHNTLCPRTKGITNIIENTKLDSIVQTVITYPDDVRRTKARHYLDFITNNMPRISHIITYDITHLFKNIPKRQIHDIIIKHWRDIDTIIQKQYELYNQKLDDFITHIPIFHDYVIEYPDITWNSAKYLIYFIPVSYLTHGFIYAAGTTMVLYTSYQYHIHKKHKLLDIATSAAMVITSYTYSHTTIGTALITFGLVLYSIEKMIEYMTRSSNKLILYYLHSSMHMFVFVYIVIEFLHKYMYLLDQATCKAFHNIGI